MAAPARSEKRSTAGAQQTVSRGEALFRGAEALVARIRGHRSPLPPEVVRCVNCHGDADARPASKTIAPVLDRALLMEARERRGGPPGAYDRESFCKLLRTGVDPVHVLVAREMPTYEIDDPGCAALWSYLTEEKASIKRPDEQKARSRK